MTALRAGMVSRLNALWYGRSGLHWLLWPIACVYRMLVAIRRWSYRCGVFRSFDVGVPVIVVGNLTVGGTGKTPLTIWLATRLLQSGMRTGIVCRGYLGASQGWPVLADAASDPAIVGDEAVLLARRTGCPVAVGPDRVAAANRLLATGPMDVIVADDGLQHYRLRRSYEIVVVDGQRGFGNGLCLPAGPLREPKSRLGSVDAVVVNDGAGDAFPTALKSAVSAVRVSELATGIERPLSDFRGRAVHGVAGIGNPDRFFDLLARHGVVVERHPLPDHAAIGRGDLSFGDGHPVLMTEKDAVKCNFPEVGNLWCVITELEFAPADGERLERDVVGRLLRKPANK